MKKLTGGGGHTLAIRLKREQEKAVHRLKNPKVRPTIQQVRNFTEPCFKCGAARECEHRSKENG